MRKLPQLLSYLLVCLMLSAINLAFNLTDPHAARADDTASDIVEESEDFVWDPIEPVNRGVFWFNNQLDRFVLEPVAEGYDYVLPKFVKKGVTNFFNNLKFPSRLLSDLVQLKFDQAGTHTERFIINSTIGVIGVMDIADFHFGLKDHREDFGTALGYYGIGEGPYLVLPLLGPSNLRDFAGELVDGAINPVTMLTYTSSVPTAIQNSVVYGLRGLNIINTRARLLEAIRTAKASAVDYYLFVQSAYHQSRQNDIYDGNPPGKDSLEQELDAKSGINSEESYLHIQN